MFKVFEVVRGEDVLRISFNMHKRPSTKDFSFLLNNSVVERKYKK
jgi:hypothetical protein